MILSCAIPRPRRALAALAAIESAVTVPAEVVGSSIGRLSHHCMMSGDECDGLELVRRPYNGCGITRLAVRALFDLRRGLAPRCEWSCSQLRCDLSERPLSTGLTASTPGMVLAIKSRTWEAFKRSYYSLVTFSPYIEPNVPYMVYLYAWSVHS